MFSHWWSSSSRNPALFGIAAILRRSARASVSPSFVCLETRSTFGHDSTARMSDASETLEKELDAVADVVSVEDDEKVNQEGEPAPIVELSPEEIRAKTRAAVAKDLSLDSHSENLPRKRPRVGVYQALVVDEEPTDPLREPATSKWSRGRLSQAQVDDYLMFCRRLLFTDEDAQCLNAKKETTGKSSSNDSSALVLNLDEDERCLEFLHSHGNDVEKAKLLLLSTLPGGMEFFVADKLHHNRPTRYTSTPRSSEISESETLKLWKKWLSDGESAIENGCPTRPGLQLLKDEALVLPRLVGEKHGTTFLKRVFDLQARVDSKLKEIDLWVSTLHDAVGYCKPGDYSPLEELEALLEKTPKNVSLEEIHVLKSIIDEERRWAKTADEVLGKSYALPSVVVPESQLVPWKGSEKKTKSLFSAKVAKPKEASTLGVGLGESPPEPIAPPSPVKAEEENDSNDEEQPSLLDDVVAYRRSYSNFVVLKERREDSPPVCTLYELKSLIIAGENSSVDHSNRLDRLKTLLGDVESVRSFVWNALPRTRDPIDHRNSTLERLSWKESIHRRYLDLKPKSELRLALKKLRSTGIATVEERYLVDAIAATSEDAPVLTPRAAS